MSNNTNMSSSAQKLYDILRKKSSQGQPTSASLSMGNGVTATVSLPDPSEDTTPLSYTVREALEIAYAMYQADYPGPDIYAHLNGEESDENPNYTITDSVKSEVSDMISYYGQSLFEKKLQDAESLSSWEAALSKLIAVPDRAIMRLQLPLGVSLPRFRALDLVKTEIADCHESFHPDMSVSMESWDIPNPNTKSWDVNGNPLPPRAPGPARLHPVRAFEERNSKRHVKTYCFTTRYSDPKVRPVIAYSVDMKDSNHVSLMDMVFQQEVVVCKFSGRAKPFLGAKFHAMVVDRIEFIS